MANFILTDVNAYVHGYDFTGDSNSVSLSPEVDVQDATTFGSGGYHVKRGGLKNVTAEVQGFFDGSPDSESFSGLGVADRVISFVPQGGTAGNVAYMFQGGNFTYQAFGAVGDMTPFQLGVEGTNKAGLVRGALSKVKGTQSATGLAGIAQNLGAGAAGKYLYGALHVFSSGTTITMKLEQATTQGGSYTAVDAGNLGTFNAGAITTAGSYWLRFDSTALTGPWYRINATACTGSFTIAASLGIQ